MMVYTDGNIRIDLVEKEGVAFNPIEKLENTYSKDIMNLLIFYISLLLKLKPNLWSKRLVTLLRECILLNQAIFTVIMYYYYLCTQ